MHSVIHRGRVRNATTADFGSRKGGGESKKGNVEETMASG